MKKTIIALALCSLCTVIALPFFAGGGKAQIDEDYFIAAEPGANSTALRTSVAALFNDEELAETRALVIMRNGEVILERYAPGYNQETRFISWSMAKTITGVLTGIMVADGRLALDEPAPVRHWQRAGDPRGAISLRHLLQMRSGLSHGEAISPPYQSDEVRMLFLDGRDDMAAYAEAQPLEAEPGTKFEYSTNTSVILDDIITNILSKNSEDPAIRRKAMQTFIEGRFKEPLGLNSMVPEYDRHGTLVGGSIIQANARDYAKFGEFLRNKGAVDGVQIVPKNWVEFMATSSPEDPAYGGHLWINKKRPEGRSPVLFPDNGPDNIIACLGHLGQFIIVSPDQNLVVVRLGMTLDEDMRAVHLALGQIISLFPKG